MKERLGQAVRRVRGALPDFRDVHVYGGLVLFAWAGREYGPWPLMVAGAFLVYLGVWRFR